MKIIRIVTFIFTALLLSACQSDDEGKTVGFVFPEECAACHGDDAEYQLKGAQMGYEHSGHALGFERHDVPHAYYANAGDCQKCHTHEGFLEFVETGTVDEDNFVKWPSQPGCFTCHNSHASGDFELRISSAVTMANGATFDNGKGNLCVNCHQSRRDVTKLVVELTADKVSPYFGPHHGPQGDIYNGSNGYEYAGKSYSNSAHKLEIEDSCVSCHMALPEGRYSSTPDIGGHSFGMSGAVHGQTKVNVAACTSCHEAVKQDKSGPYFDYMASADFDQDGSVEVVQLEVIGLLARLVNEEGTGALQTMANPFYGAEGGFIRSNDENLIRTVEEVAAIYNFKLFGEEDRSNGMHNSIYTVQILTDTIASMDSSFNTSNRPE